MNQKPIRVLQVISDFKKGGVQADVMYSARIIDRQRVQFDVMLLSDTIGYYEEEFRKYGDIYRINLKRKKTKIFRALSFITNFFHVYREMKIFLKRTPDYDAIEARHIILNAPCLLAAKKAKIPVRIAHCHVNKPQKENRERLYVRIYLWVCAKILNRCATHRFGVTQSACDYMFGKNKGIVVKNPTVNLEKFNPNKYKNIDNDTINLIIIGSYGERKNQKFAVEVFEELQKKEEKSHLTLIGYPRVSTDTYLPNLKEYVEEHDLENNVSFLPQDSDIPYELSKSTYMLIPSLLEGLPNVALEAQAMGIPCFVSTNVSDDCNCGICEFLPLSIGAKGWADAILEYRQKHGVDKQYVDMSEWDNRKVCEEYIKYWSGEKNE